MAIKTEHLKIINQEVDVRTFDSYPSFLEAVYKCAKGIFSAYSYVQLSIDLGIGSSNVHSVINGKRKISEKIGQRIATRLHLNSERKKYFLALIKSEGAQNPEDREQAFEAQLNSARKRLGSDLDRNRLLFFEHWYHAAVIELLRLEQASDDPKWIADAIQPKVTLPQVKSSLELLKTLNYIEFDLKRGRLFPTETTISTGDEVERIAILSFHRQMIDLAVSAMDKIPAEERDISAITVSVSSALKEQMMAELKDLRKKFLKLSAEDKNPSEIVQLNLQIFPLTKSKGTP